MREIFDNIGNGSEYENPQYLCDYAVKCIAMNRQLSETSHPYDRSMVILKSLLEFYQADSCGIMEWSLQRNTWIPSLWYTKDGGELDKTIMPAEKLDEGKLNWFEAFKQKDAEDTRKSEIVIEDIKQIKRKWSPVEMNLLDKCAVSNIQIIWFSMQIEGLIFVTNPRYAATQTDFLHMASSLLIPMVAELKMLNMDFDRQGTDPILDQELDDNEWWPEFLGI